MSTPNIKELIVYKKELLLKSALQDHLEEHEYIFQHTLFNGQGKVVSEVHYDAEGSIVQDYQYKYDVGGLLLEKIMKENDGFVAEHITWEYDVQGNVSRELRHYTDGSFDTIQYSYNDEGLVCKKETIDPDGDLETVEEIEYDNGLLARQVVCDADENVLNENRMKYDDKGNPVEYFEYDGMEDTSIRKVTEYYPSGTKKEVLTYNSQGKLVEKVILQENQDGQLVEAIEETLTRKNTVNFVYDGDGNIILQEEIDKYGALVSRVNRVFDQNKQLLSSNVYIDGGGRGLSRNYSLRQEFIYF